MENQANYFDTLKKWFAKFEKYKVRYRNGFFHLTNLANSPSTIVESFDKMPFCKHNKEKGFLSANTIFFNGRLHYYEIEKGLWVLFSDNYYKKNLSITSVSDPSIPAEFHLINLHLKKSIENKSMVIKGSPQAHKIWSAYKGDETIVDHHFKESNEINITIYFSQEWFEQKSINCNYLKESQFNHFIESKKSTLFLSEMEEKADVLYANFSEVLDKNDSSSKKEKLKELSEVFFKCFIEKYTFEGLEKNHFNLEDKDRRAILQVEKYLSDCLPNSFPGIEIIANHIGISPTKLKSDFKAIHQLGLFQFYRNKQMTLAYQMFIDNKVSVKEIALLMGYANVSKFSTAFKNQYHILPSELTNVNQNISVVQ